MPQSRHLRWVGLGLASLFGLALVILWLTRLDRTQKASKNPRKEAPQVSETTVKMLGEPQRLVPGQPIAAELKGGEGRAYELDLKAGDYVYVVVDQQGIDVAVRLLGPDGQTRLYVDSPNLDKGPEPVYDVADVTGIHRLEVTCSDPEVSAGRYQVKIEVLRPAKEEDRRRTAAERQFMAAEALRREGKKESYRHARDLYRETLPAFQQLAVTDREAYVWYRLGWMSRLLSDFAEALTDFEHALSLYRRLGKRSNEAETLDWIGEVHYRRGEFALAAEKSSTAATIAHEVGDRAVETSALNNTANADVALGEVEKALEAYRRAQAMAHEDHNLKDEGVALYGIGNVLTNHGKPEQALDVLQQALEIFRKEGTQSYQADILSRLANVYQRLGRLADARARLEGALAIRVASGDRDGEAIALNSLGTLHLLAKEVDKAGEAYRRALTLAQATGSRHNEAFSLLNLGRYYYEVKDDQQALKYHDQAAEIFHTLGYRPGEVSTLFGSARALHRLGNYEDAHERLERVLAGVETMRNEPGSIDLRTGFLATKQNYYDLHIDVLMHLHEKQPRADWDAVALRLHERRRARGMLDLLSEAGAQIRRGADPAVLAREQELEREIAAADSALLDARDRGKTEKAKALEAGLRQLLLDLDTVRTEIRTRSPRYASLVRPEPLSLPEIQRQVVGEKSLLLVYALGEERSFLFCIPRHGAMTSYVLPKREQIEGVARQALRFLQVRTEPQERARLLRELSDILLKPIKDVLGDRLLVVVADGALESLPFAVLPDPRDSGPKPLPLIVKNEVVHLPSATVLATLRKELADRLPAPRRIAIVADPVFTADDERLAGRAGDRRPASAAPANVELARSAREVGVGLARLPYTKGEVQIVDQLVRPEQRLEASGFAANKALVTSGELRRYRILHFATHGLLNEKHPELSGLVLSLFDEQGKPQDGFLRGYEICNLDLPAELAVLSACQTGLGSEIRGEGLVGLTRSFMYAGVPRIVVSLWNVSDQGTAELMKLFYRGLLEKKLRPSMALRCAQLAMLDEEPWRDPYYWGAFIFQGEWRLETGSPDDDVEARSTASSPGTMSDGDLPPPRIIRAAGCPDLR